MSHVVTIRTQVRDPQAVRSACSRLKLPAPVHGPTKLFVGEKIGRAVMLSGWVYPVVCNTSTGEVDFDNDGGSRSIRSGPSRLWQPTATMTYRRSWLLKSFHRFTGSGEVVAEIAKTVTGGETHRNFVVVLSPVVQLPPELERLFIVVDYEPPTREELRELLSGVATEGNEMPTGGALDAVLDAAAGLTRFEAENAFLLSLVRHAAICPDTIWELKTQALKKSGLLNLCRSESDFSSLGGLLGERQLKYYRSHLVALASRQSKHGRDAHATWYVCFCRSPY